MRQALWRNLSTIDLQSIHPTVPSEIDLVISGGGFLGYYLVGMDRVLKKLSREKIIRIVRYSGTSVGALASVAMICGIGKEMIALYDQLQGHPDYFPKIREYFLSILPEDAHERCSGRLFICITTFHLVWNVIPCFRPMVVSSFQSKEDLVEACMASSNFPFFVSPNLFYRYRGMRCLDGCFTRNLNVFHDGARPQLLVRLIRIPYSWRSAFSPFQDLITPLIVRGALETERFLTEGGQTSGALEWHPGRKTRWSVWMLGAKLTQKHLRYGALGLLLGVCIGISRRFSYRPGHMCGSDVFRLFSIRR